MKSLLAIIALTSLAVACGDDAKSDDTADTIDVADTTPVDTTVGEPIDELDPSTVKVFTSAEVCALVSQAVATTTLGLEVTGVDVSDLSTPQCFYNFTVDGTSTNLTLAVQRPIEDLGGAAGKAGFDFTTSLVIFDVPYEPLAGLGDEAAVSASETLTIVAVLADDQVFTIVTSTPIDIANLVAFGNAAVESLSG